MHSDTDGRRAARPSGRVPAFTGVGYDKQRRGGVSAAEADLGRPASRGRATVWLLVAIAAMAAFFLGSYRDALGTFFYLDDYWVLAKGAQIAVRSPLDVAHFFVPTQGFFFYRPVSTVMYFHVLHALFGTDPFGFHAVHLGAHVVNGLLVYAVADRLFFSRPLALATALVYAAAPGHAFAAYWVALFTVTGTALFYFLGLWVWLAVDGRGR